jgi:hypothetical protein
MAKRKLKQGDLIWYLESVCKFVRYHEDDRLIIAEPIVRADSLLNPPFYWFYRPRNTRVNLLENQEIIRVGSYRMASQKEIAGAIAKIMIS